MFTFSIKRRIRRFYIVVVQSRCQRNVLTCDARAEKLRSQGSFSSLEKEPWLRLVTWKCVLINCAAGVDPPLNFVHWTMKYYLG